MQIGKRIVVTNLRDIWPFETDFSDYLVTPDGLELLQTDIGVAIEEPRRECRPGDYPCDIVGRMVGEENHVVVVENQFGKTDHDHLGKLLTYAAMNGAITAIWISEHISGDHRKAVDWLNENTPAQVGFYLAQIKAYRIDDSPVAPQLDVVCRPNLQAKVQKGAGTNEEKERHLWRRAFWEEIFAYFDERKPAFRHQAPSIDPWTSIAVGRAGFVIALSLTPKNKCIGCELTITVNWKNDAFQQLYDDKEQIEREIGAPLQWRQMHDRKSARILLEAPINPRDDTKRDEVKAWMFDTCAKFYAAFPARVRKLQPTSTYLLEAATLDEEDPPTD